MEDFEPIEKNASTEEASKPKVKRSVIDRRSGEDVRKRYNLDYFIEGGEERRKGKERRQSEERRKGWVRVYNWCSVYLGRKAL